MKCLAKANFTSDQEGAITNTERQDVNYCPVSQSEKNWPRSGGGKERGHCSGPSDSRNTQGPMCKQSLQQWGLHIAIKSYKAGEIKKRSKFLSQTQILQYLIEKTHH